MADLIDRQKIIEQFELLAKYEDPFSQGVILGVVYTIKCAPAVDAVSRGVYEQIKWERDIAMSQLEEHGIAFGAKAERAVDAVEVVRCKDCEENKRVRLHSVSVYSDIVARENGGKKMPNLKAEIKCIDLGVAIGALLDMASDYAELDAWKEETITMCARELRKLPTIDPESLRPTGEWINLTKCANEGVYCSVCRKKVYKADYAWAVKKNKVRSNFCPNCGAKMKGESECSS